MDNGHEIVDTWTHNVDNRLHNVDKYLFSGDNAVENGTFTLLRLC